MNTQDYEKKVKRITRALRLIVHGLQNAMALTRNGNYADNKGLQYKINTSTSRDGTIALRGNHVLLSSVPKYISTIVGDLEITDTLPLLELISVNKAYQTDATTQRKKSIPHKRTIFVTLRPPRDIYDELLKQLPDAAENYMEIPKLLNVLSQLIIEYEAR